MIDERMKILDMIEQGTITAAQGAELLLALEEGDENVFEEEQEDEMEKPDVATTPDIPPSPAPSPVSFAPLPDPAGAPETPRAAPSPAPSLDPKFARWRRWWSYPLTFGLLITIFSGWLLYLGTQNEWAGFWMACIWLPLLFGIFVVTLAWLSKTSLWVHVRVNTGQDEWPRRIAISLPLPLRLGAWFFRTFQDKIPGIPNMDDVPLDDLITAVEKGVKPEAPIYIQVEERGSERVEVYIG